jgi:hypothetical protein
MRNALSRFKPGGKEGSRGLVFRPVAHLFNILVMLISWARSVCTGAFCPHLQDCPLAPGGPMLVCTSRRCIAHHCNGTGVWHCQSPVSPFDKLQADAGSPYISRALCFCRNSPSPRLVLKFPLCCTTAFRKKIVNICVSKMQCRLAHACVSRLFAIVPEFLQQPRNFPSGSN